MTSLQYRDEEDKAFGLAGMIYSLGAVDGLDSVAEVSLDTDGPMVTFRHGYFFNGSPAVSPKSTWDNMLRNFHLTSVMVLSNLMSRTIVKDAEEPDSKLLQEIRDLFEEEGERECSLEKDELDALYDRILHYTMRLFRNPRVHPGIKMLTSELTRTRKLTGRDLYDALLEFRLI